jgi:D-3-phosphoglycerate dehydrogenase / 2-oxoglutarate reductase
MTVASRPLVVLAGHLHPDARTRLEGAARVVVVTEPTEPRVVEAARDAEAILFRGGPRGTESLIAGCPRLRVIGRHGAGLDTVDLAAATRAGVAVVHAPGANAQAVAEHALMLMLACAKRARQIDRNARTGDWSARHVVENVELAGRTIGIVGIGNIGRRVARFAGALGMTVLAYDPFVPPDEVRRRGAEPVASLDALLPQVDVLTCHTPLTDLTRHMINEKTLALLKQGAIFVNTSRGGVQSEPALFQALVTGRLAAAGLDVFEQEPSPLDNPLFNLDTVVCSTHIAGVTREAHRATGFQVIDEMLRVLRGERPHVLANPEVWPRPITPR